jgi:hypothetical protein
MQDNFHPNIKEESCNEIGIYCAGNKRQIILISSQLWFSQAWILFRIRNKGDRNISLQLRMRSISKVKPKDNLVNWADPEGYWVHQLFVPIECCGLVGNRHYQKVSNNWGNKGFCG